jgi:hypothetical protein
MKTAIFLLIYKARTPYQRLLDSDYLSLHEKQKMNEFCESLNPIELRKELNARLKFFQRVYEGKVQYKYKFSA